MTKVVYNLIYLKLVAARESWHQCGGIFFLFLLFLLFSWLCSHSSNLFGLVGNSRQAIIGINDGIFIDALGFQGLNSQARYGTNDDNNYTDINDNDNNGNDDEDDDDNIIMMMILVMITVAISIITIIMIIIILCGKFTWTFSAIYSTGSLPYWGFQR